MKLERVFLGVLAMHHLMHLQEALSRSCDRVQEVVRVGGREGHGGDPNSSHTCMCTRAHTHTRFHPCITDQSQAATEDARPANIPPPLLLPW